MRVLLLNDSIGTIAGSNQACLRIGRRLVAAGHEVHWAGRREPMTAAARAGIAGAGVHLVSLPHQVSRGWLQVLAHQAHNPTAVAALKTAAERLRPDWALVCNVHNGLSASAIAALDVLDVPVVFYPFDNWHWCVRKYNHVPGELAPCRACVDGPSPRIVAAGCGGRFPMAVAHTLLRAQRWSPGGPLPRVRGWIAASAFHEEVLSRQGVPAAHMLRLAFPIDVEPAVPAHTGSAFVYFGATIGCKGTELLVEALARCAGLELEMYITDEPSARLRQAIARARERNRVTTNGDLRWTTGLKERVRAALAVVVPSLWDSVGEQTLLESLALGKAALASDVSVHRDWIEDGRSGFLARVGDVQDWARQLARVAGAAEQLDAVGAAAQARMAGLQAGWAERLTHFASSLAR